MGLVAVLIISFFPLAVWTVHLARSLALSAPRAIGVALLGLGAALAASLLQASFAPFFRASALSQPALLASLDAFARIALSEEAAKLAAVALASRGLLARRLPSAPRETASEWPVLARAVLVSLSFAAFENLFYGIRFPGSLTLRTLAVLPLHVSLTVFASLALTRGPRAFPYFLAAVLIHGAYNLCMAAGFPLSFAGFLLVAILSFAAYAVMTNAPGSPSHPEDGA